MDESNVIGFYRPEDENGYLSNWYPAKFEYAGQVYTSTEQFMMAQKAMVFRDYTNYRKIMQTNDLANIKAFGRKVQPYDDAIWSQIRGYIMRCGIRAKFQQNPDILKRLLETGNKVLAECSARDKVWGIGLGITNKDVQNPLRWNGKNLLGIVLMQVRTDLRRWVLASNGNVDYIDARDKEPIDVWNMHIAEVSLLPECKETLNVYAKIVSLRDEEINFFTSVDCTMFDIELAMRTNMGGGLPAAWFWEMKQDIFDTIRFLGD